MRVRRHPTPEAPLLQGAVQPDPDPHGHAPSAGRLPLHAGQEAGNLPASVQGPEFCGFGTAGSRVQLHQGRSRQIRHRRRDGEFLLFRVSFIRFVCKLNQLYNFRKLLAV